ncbi:acetyltransferase [Flavobacteriaceae bacterium]|nr:acetyltransferase [Flavobacteriaceae bacterium]
MSKVIIFGLLDTAELAYYYLLNDSEHDVVAFTVHDKYIKCSQFKGLPVVPFEGIENRFPPSEFYLFAPMTGKVMNHLREKIYNAGKHKGYNFITYISSKATWFDNEIGENCFILEDNTIQPFTKIGDNVILWSGNHIGHHGVIKDHVFITSHVVISGHCLIESNCFLGVNATVRDYTHMAKGTLLAMGANLTLTRTEEWGIYIGNPAIKNPSKLSHEIF